MPQNTPIEIPGSNACWDLESINRPGADRDRLIADNTQMIDTLSQLLHWTNLIAGKGGGPDDYNAQGQDSPPRARLCGEFRAMVTSIREQILTINEQAR